MTFQWRVFYIHFKTFLEGIFKFSSLDVCFLSCLCSGQWHLSKSSVECERPLPGCGDSEQAVPPEEQDVCLGWSQRAELEWTGQYSRKVWCTSRRGWVPFDWLCPFWWSLARLYTSLQGLPEAVPESTENGNKPLSNRYRLRELLMVLGKKRWSIIKKSAKKTQRRTCWNLEDGATLFWAHHRDKQRYGSLAIITGYFCTLFWMLCNFLLPCCRNNSLNNLVANVLPKLFCLEVPIWLYLYTVCVNVFMHEWDSKWMNDELKLISCLTGWRFYSHDDTACVVILEMKVCFVKSFL